jgi:hypothetical protein
MTYAGLFGDTCISALCCVVLVQMRFCRFETSCEQDDHWPPFISVTVNGRLCPLPVSNKFCYYKGKVLDDTTVLLDYIHIEICYMFQLVLSQCLANGDICTADSRRTVTWRYVNECKNFFCKWSLLTLIAPVRLF